MPLRRKLSGVPRLDVRGAADHAAQACSNLTETWEGAPTCSHHQPKVCAATEPRPTTPRSPAGVKDSGLLGKRIRVCAHA